MKKISLLPAYGRDYKSKKEIEGSLLGNLDFMVADVSSPYNGRYINLPQIKEAGFTHLNVRYAKLAKIHVVEIAKLKEPKLTKKPGWYVQIIETKTGKVEKEMGPMVAGKAQKVGDGVSINLDHDRFSVKTVEIK